MVIIAVLVLAVVTYPPGPVDTGTVAAHLALSTTQIYPAGSYSLTATGFFPGEHIRLSWTGPTIGIMGTFVADRSGRVEHGPVTEQDLPGNYQITATGLATGRSVSVPLRVAAG